MYRLKKVTFNQGPFFYFFNTFEIKLTRNELERCFPCFNNPV